MRIKKITIFCAAVVCIVGLAFTKMASAQQNDSCPHVEGTAAVIHLNSNESIEVFGHVIKLDRVQWEARSNKYDTEKVVYLTIDELAISWAVEHRNLRIIEPQGKVVSKGLKLWIIKSSDHESGDAVLLAVSEI